MARKSPVDKDVTLANKRQQNNNSFVDPLVGLVELFLKRRINYATWDPITVVENDRDWRDAINGLELRVNTGARRALSNAAASHTLHRGVGVSSFLLRVTLFALLWRATFVGGEKARNNRPAGGQRERLGKRRKRPSNVAALQANSIYLLMNVQGWK